MIETWIIRDILLLTTDIGTKVTSSLQNSKVISMGIIIPIGFFLLLVHSYEESQLHDSIYQLHVKLLAADKSTVISEYSINPTEDRSNYSHTWKEVSFPALSCATNATCMHRFFYFKYLVVCVYVCWPAGFACVLWLWTWGEICPLPAPAEEHVFEWLLQHHVYQQLSGCQANQNKQLTSLSCVQPLATPTYSTCLFGRYIFTHGLSKQTKILHLYSRTCTWKN